MYKYLFGPVPSRRLGVSLGVDLVPHKVCSLNCLYCECGITTNLTVERKGDKVFVGGTEILMSVKVSNGWIHVVGDVLVPSDK